MANSPEDDILIRKTEEILRAPTEPSIDLELPYDTCSQLITVIRSEVDAARAFEGVIGVSIRVSETSAESIHAQLLKKLEASIDTNPDNPDTSVDKLIIHPPIPLSLDGREVDFMNNLLLGRLGLSDGIIEGHKDLSKPDYLERFLPKDSRIIAEVMGQMIADRRISDAANMKTFVQLNEQFEQAGGKPRQSYLEFRKGKQ